MANGLWSDVKHLKIAQAKKKKKEKKSEGKTAQLLSKTFEEPGGSSWMCFREH